jgi:hypothetical protein
MNGFASCKKCGYSAGVFNLERGLCKNCRAEYSPNSYKHNEKVEHNYKKTLSKSAQSKDLRSKESSVTRIYGISCFLNSLIILLMIGFPSYLVILGIIDGKFKIGNLVFFAIAAAFLIPTIKFLVESIHAIKGNMEISPKSEGVTKTLYSIGMFMVSASALVHIGTIIFVVYVFISGSAGGSIGIGSAGIGSAFGSLLFSGYFLLKYTMQKHNNSKHAEL